MRTPSCPFSAECHFQNSSAKTPSDVILRMLYCQSAGYAACEIAKKKAEGKPVSVSVGPMGAPAQKQRASHGRVPLG